MTRQATADVVVPRERASASVQVALSRAASAPIQPSMRAQVAARSYSLAEQQQLFLGAITSPDDTAADEHMRVAAELVTPSETLSQWQRLEIYRSGYHARLIECLADDYSALQRALGESAFEQLCQGYIARYPSRGPSLNAFGQHMPEYCASLELENARFLAELAELEWTIVEAIHAPGGSILKPEDLATIPEAAWPEVKLLVNPSLTILRCEYPVNAYFQALRAAKTPTIPEPNASAVAVYRTGRSVWRLPLDAGMADLLQMLVAGEPLAQATEQISSSLTNDSMEEAAAKVTRWFSHAVSSGLFSGIALPQL